MLSLATKKGYRLVGSNHYGFNLIFVRTDIFPERVPAVPLDSVQRYPRHIQRLKLAQPIKDWEYAAL